MQIQTYSFTFHLLKYYLESNIEILHDFLILTYNQVTYLNNVLESLTTRCSVKASLGTAGYNQNC